MHNACTYNVSDVLGQCKLFPNAMGLDHGIAFLLDNVRDIMDMWQIQRNR